MSAQQQDPRLVSVVEHELKTLINSLKMSRPESETEIYSALFMEFTDVLIMRYGVAEGLSWIEKAIDQYCKIVLELDAEDYE